MYPFLNFFPAVQLARNLELGEWTVGTPDENVAWRAGPFRELATKLLEASGPKEFKKPALVWHRERGFDGTYPSEDVARAIQAAVRFALLDYNDQVSRDYNTAYYLATSENGVFYRQPIDENERSVAHETGGALKSTLIGGWKIGERAVSLPDATQVITRPVPVSRCLAAAVYAALVGQGQAAPMMATAIEWHAVALANPKAVTLQQRIIALKTGFEALFGKSNSAACAAALRKLFEDTARPHNALFPWAGCLWSPTERVDLPRQYTNKKGRPIAVKRSELEDWFMALPMCEMRSFTTGAFRQTFTRRRPSVRFRGTRASSSGRPSEYCVRRSRPPSAPKYCCAACWKNKSGTKRSRQRSWPGSRPALSSHRALNTRRHRQLFPRSIRDELSRSC